MEQSLSNERLQKQNDVFKGTAGVSEGNREQNFVPAFFDTDSKIVHISRFSNGLPAPIHLLDGLPEEWVSGRDGAGHVTTVIGSVIAGFSRNKKFYTREQVASLVNAENLH